MKIKGRRNYNFAINFGRFEPCSLASKEQYKSLGCNEDGVSEEFRQMQGMMLRSGHAGHPSCKLVSAWLSVTLNTYTETEFMFVYVVNYIRKERHESN
jgi:hypothetical protein